MSRECYHCHQIIEEGEKHDCWTTTERALTANLSEDLMDAWERLRETANEFGEQRIYASHHSIMFSRKVCYFFVRPKKKVLEVWFFLGRTVKSPMMRKTMQSSKTKVAASGPRDPQGPGGITAHGLAQRGFRRFRRIERKTQKETRQKETREEEVADQGRAKNSSRGAA